MVGLCECLCVCVCLQSAWCDPTDRCGSNPASVINATEVLQGQKSQPLSIGQRSNVNTIEKLRHKRMHILAEPIDGARRPESAQRSGESDGVFGRRVILNARIVENVAIRGVNCNKLYIRVSVCRKSNLYQHGMPHLVCVRGAV